MYCQIQQDLMQGYYSHKERIYVIGFSFPVVPRGQVCIRVQISTAHEKEHLV